MEFQNHNSGYVIVDETQAADIRKRNRKIRESYLNKKVSVRRRIEDIKDDLALKRELNTLENEYDHIIRGGSIKGVFHLAKNQGYSTCSWCVFKNGLWTIGGLR